MVISATIMTVPCTPSLPPKAFHVKLNLLSQCNPISYKIPELVLLENDDVK